MKALDELLELIESIYTNIGSDDRTLTITFQQCQAIHNKLKGEGKISAKDEAELEHYLMQIKTSVMGYHTAASEEIDPQSKIYLHKYATFLVNKLDKVMDKSGFKDDTNE